MKKARLTKEQALREAVRVLVRKMIKEAEETEKDPAAEEAPEDATATPDAAAKQEPTKQEPEQPEPAPEEEGLNSDFQTATDAFIRKLAQSTGTPSADDLVDMMSQMIERFTTTSEERLNLLKGIRNNTVH
jgi:hypothetical protein